MKVIQFESGLSAYEKIFSKLLVDQSILVAWQSTPSNERLVIPTKLQSFSLELKLLHFEIRDLSLDKELPVFFYSEDSKFIFKANIQSFKDGMVSTSVPNEVKLLDGDENEVVPVKVNTTNESDVLRVRRVGFGYDDVEEGEGYMRVKSMAQRTPRDQELLNSEFQNISIDEEDKIFADKRESPRARPKVDKWVLIRLANSTNINRLKLFDLSQGGMSFVTFDMMIFPKGAVIYLLGLDDYKLDDPLIGRVMSHRAIDETESDWKVGVMFDEGQD